MNKFKYEIINIIKSTLISVGVTIISLLIVSMLLTYTSVKENIINPSIIVINGLAILIGTIHLTKKKKNKGMLRGGILGLVYILIIYIISSFIKNSFEINKYSIIMIISSTFLGIIGGIIGVNIKNSLK